MFDIRKEELEDTLRSIDKDIKETGEKIEEREELGKPTTRLKKRLNKLYISRYEFKETLKKKEKELTKQSTKGLSWAK